MNADKSPYVGPGCHGVYQGFGTLFCPVANASPHWRRQGIGPGKGARGSGQLYGGVSFQGHQQGIGGAETRQVQAWQCPFIQRHSESDFDKGISSGPARQK
jgi:hypothetical protein